VGEVAAARPYRALLRTRHVPALFGWALCSRLPIGMTALAIVLLVRGTGGSYGEAGVVVGCGSIARAVASPLLGRLVDRLGNAPVLVPAAALFPVSCGGLAALALAHAPLVALAACAVAVGASTPATNASLRATWPRVLPAPDDRATAYTLDAALQELIFVVGPLLVAVLAAAVSPTAAVATAAAVGSVGTLGFVRLPPVRAWRPHPDRGRPGLAGALTSRAVRVVCAVMLCCGFAFGAVEVAMPAFAEEHGRRALGGLALACFAGGSLVGGLLAGLRPPADRRRRFRVAAGYLVGGVALLLAAPDLPAMCALIFVAGLPIAPAFGSAYTLVDEGAPVGTQAEAFSWISTAIGGGLAAGTSAGGLVLDGHGVRAALLVGVGGAGLAALLALRG
jgi:MFS family permease